MTSSEFVTTVSSGIILILFARPSVEVPGPRMIESPTSTNPAASTAISFLVVGLGAGRPGPRGRKSGHGRIPRPSAGANRVD